MIWTVATLISIVYLGALCYCRRYIIRHQRMVMDRMVDEMIGPRPIGRDREAIGASMYNGPRVGARVYNGPRPGASVYNGPRPPSDVIDFIINALREPCISTIGIYGQGGRAKDVAKRVKRRCERDNLFDRIVAATVSNKPDLARVQAEIGKALHMDFDDVAGTSGKLGFRNKMGKMIAERARRLCDKIKEQPRILVVLFDLNKGVDLGKIGIPSRSDLHGGCKMLVTSTSQEVLSQQMKTAKLIPV